MAVAHLCTNTYRDLIIHYCQSVLQLKSRMLELTRSLKHASSSSQHRKEHGEVCESMLDVFCQLEENVNMALLHLMVDVFKESTEPLERLLKVALSPSQTSVSSSVKVMVSDFSDHADRIYQVASLAAASSTDSKRVRVIRASVYHLEKLDPDIVPSIKTVAKQPANMAALRHLKLLVKDWKSELSALVQVLDEMVDPELFIEVSENRIDDDISAVLGFILEEDQEGASEAIACVFCRVKRVRQIAQAVVDHSTDAIFMNGLLVFVRKLQQAESITKEALKYLNRDFYNPRLQETFMKHLNLLKGFVGQVKDGLSADNHPDILSPERMMVYKKRRTIISGSRLHKKAKVKQMPLYKRSHPDNPVRVDSDLDLASDQPTSLKKQMSQSSSSSKEQSQTKERQLSPTRSSQSSTEVGLGVKMSDIRLLAKQFVSAAVAGDRQRVNVLTSDLLGWTNHIADAAQSLGSHCTGLEHKDELHSLCQEADQLAPEAINKAKYVAAGDIGEVASLQHTADAWGDKLDKARIHLDVAVEQWKILADCVLTAIQKGNVDRLKTDISTLENHKEALCSLLIMVDCIPTDTLPELETTLTFLKEQQDDLENLTVTIKTTADLTLQTGNATDISIYRSQLGQLCREWSVMVTCILGDIDSLTSCIQQTGHKRISAIREITPDLANLGALEAESEKVKGLLDSVCIGDDVLKSRSAEICKFFDSCLEELQTSETRGFENVQDRSVYITRQKHLLLSQWIIKVMEAQKLICDQTTELYEPLETLHAQALVIHRLSLTDPSTFSENKTDYLCEVSKMAANFTMMQQKVLNAIQLSPDLPKRAVVRRCLDNIAVLSPQLLDKMKTFVDDNGPSDTEQDWQEMRIEWAASVKKLLLTLQQMSDLRPTLNTEIIKLLTPEPNKRLSPQKLQRLKAPDKRDLVLQTPTRQLQLNAGTPLARCRGDNSMIGTPTNKPFRSIMASTNYLEEVTSQWENKDNQVIQVAMEIVKHTKNIAEYCKGMGEIEDVSGLVASATSIVDNGRQMQTFIRTLADSCVDESHAHDLRVSIDTIGSFATQLNIINSVLQNSPNTTETERIVLRNASNLVQAVEEAFHEAESVCVKGLVEMSGEDSYDGDILTVVSEWQRKLVLQRASEASTAPRDELGLRRIEQHNPPSLVHFLQ